jgi:rubrerythrin
MAKNNYSKFTASYLDCLSMLESNTAVLYTALADKVNLPQVKSVLLGAANDSQKHSVQLKGAVENLARTKAKPCGDGKLKGRLQRDLYHLQGDN